MTDEKKLSDDELMAIGQAAVIRLRALEDLVVPLFSQEMQDDPPESYDWEAVARPEQLELLYELGLLDPPPPPESPVCEPLRDFASCLHSRLSPDGNTCLECLATLEPLAP